MGVTKTKGSSKAVSSFRGFFGLFEEYLKHLGVFSTVAVVLIACGLKGQEQKPSYGSWIASLK